MKDLVELVETLIKDYSADILRAVRREDRHFFELPIYDRERYANLTKAFPRTLLAKLQETSVVRLAEDQTVPPEEQLRGRDAEYFGPELITAREAGYKAGMEAMRKGGFARIQPLLPPSVW